VWKALIQCDSKYNNSNNLSFLQNKYKTNMRVWYNLLVAIGVSLSIMSCHDPEDPNAQLNKETKAIDAYLKDNNSDYIAYDASGMRIVIKQFGNDAPPHAGQTVQVTYTAKVFPDGAIFDSGVINDKIDNLSVLGLQRGLASILNGTHAVLYIPSKYAFGSDGRTGVPGNTTVVYDITLNEVTRTATEQTQFEADTAAIHDYIKFPNNNITGAMMLPSGIWYTMDVTGTGVSPKPYDRVTFEYKGKLLSNGSTFDSGTLYQQGIFSFIDGLKVGLPEMKEGGSAKFFIPSGYAYGVDGISGLVGSNSNLIFEVKLNDITN
jgi:FKBP-type peptidyl-prolyl cis-trans isomerase FkpA